MAESPTPAPEEVERTHGPDEASFFSSQLPDGFVMVGRHELVGDRIEFSDDSERLEIVTIPGTGEPSESGLALQRFARVNRRRLVIGLQTLPLELAGKRFKISRVHELDGTPGALIRTLRERYHLSGYWVKAEPWPFPVSFRHPPNEIDARAVAEALGCDAVLLCDPAAEQRRQATELILAPIAELPEVGPASSDERFNALH